MRTDFYRAFEDAYRGSRELITQRLQVYLPFIQKLQELREAPLKLLDMGCGRGEWLELTQQNGCEVFGIDLDEGMLAACHELGLPVQQGDALQYLRDLPDASLDVLSAFHVVEHLDFAVLEDLLTHARRVLRPAGLLILETPNPENLVVGSCNFHLDPTHVKPIPPLLLEFLSRHHGFARSKIMRLQEKPELRGQAKVSLLNVLANSSPDYAVLSQQVADAELLALFDEVFKVNYGLQLTELADRYDNARSEETLQLNKKLESGLDKLDDHFRKEMATASSQFQQWEELLGQHSKSIANLSEQLLQAHARIDQSAVHAVQLQEQLQCALAAQKEAEQQRAALNQKYNSERQQWSTQIQRLNEANRKLQAQATAYRNSWSWKVTAPLRMGLDVVLAIVQPHRWFPAALRKCADHVNASPRLHRAVYAVLRRTPALERWLLEQAHGRPEPVKTHASPLTDFEQFLEQHIRWEQKTQAGSIALMQNTQDLPSSLFTKILKQTAPKLNTGVIWRLQAGAIPHFSIEPQAGRDDSHLGVLVEYIYLALLRRYPSQHDKKDKVQYILKTKNIEKLIDHIKQSREYNGIS